MVKIFMSGVGGSGKTTLTNKLVKLKCFKKFRQVKEVAREIMKKERITKEMLETSEETYLRLQEMIIEGQRRKEDMQKDNSFVSDRSVLDCLAYILLKKEHWQHVEQVIQSHKESVTASVLLYQSSLVVLVLPWDHGSGAREDGTRISVTPQEGEQYTTCLRQVLDHFHIAYMELGEPDLGKRIELMVDAVRGKVPLANFTLEYYQALSDRKNRSKMNNLFPRNLSFYLGETAGIRTFDMFEDHYELRESGNGQHKDSKSGNSSSGSRFVNKYGVDKLVCLKFDQRVRPVEVQAMLLAGVRVGGQLFSFLGCSQGGLKGRSAFLWRGTKEEAERVLKENGDFERIKTVSKRMAREGLLFSSVELTGVQVKPEDIIEGEDSEFRGFNFTDGCGEISTELAEKVFQTIPSIPENYRPSVIQLRLQGIKGVVALNPNLEQGKIMIRPSQNKFQTSFDSCLGVAGYSKPYSFGHLNRQFIILLSGLGVPDTVFLTMHQEFFDLLEQMTRDKEAAIIVMQWRNNFDISQLLMRMSSLDFSHMLKLDNNQRELYKNTDPRNDIMKRLNETQQKILGSDTKENSDGSAKEKLRLLVRKSRLVYGVCDQDGELQYGQCQVRITTEGGLVKSLKGQAVVARNPSYLLGDIRVLEMVHVKGLEHLVDCIVFPTCGPRPHPDEMAGGDLDGDTFFVCWDPRLVPPRVVPAVDYPAAPVKKEKPVTYETKIRFFAHQKNLQGRVDSLYNKWADLTGPASDQCHRLGVLFGRTIDAAKSGEEVDIPDSLRHPEEHKDAIKKDDWVWQKLTQLSKESKARIKDAIVNDVSLAMDLVSEEFVHNLLEEKCSNISEFEKFKLCWTFCCSKNLDHQDSIEYMNTAFINKFNFALMYVKERMEVIEIGFPQAVVYNALNKSSILLQEDLEYFRSSLQGLGWCFLSASSMPEFDPQQHLLTLTEGGGVLFAFQMPDMVVVAFLFTNPLKEGERVEMEPGSVQTFFISRKFGLKKQFICPAEFFYDLNEDRFQIYRTDRTKSFFWFRSDIPPEVSDDVLLSLSIDLTRFGGNSVRRGPNFNRPHPLIRKTPFSHVELFRLPLRDEPTYLPLELANELDEVPSDKTLQDSQLMREERDVAPLILEILDRQLETLDAGSLVALMQEMVTSTAPATVVTDTNTSEHLEVTRRLKALLAPMQVLSPEEVIVLASCLSRLGQPILAASMLDKLRPSSLAQLLPALQDWYHIFHLDTEVMWQQLARVTRELQSGCPEVGVESYLITQVWHNIVHLLSQLRQFKEELDNSSGVVRGLRLEHAADDTKEEMLCLEGPGQAPWLKEGVVVGICVERHYTGTFRSLVVLASVTQATPAPLTVRLRLLEPRPKVLREEWLGEDTLSLHCLQEVNTTVYTRVLGECLAFLSTGSDSLLPLIISMNEQGDEEDGEKAQGEKEKGVEQSEDITHMAQLNPCQVAAVTTSFKQRVTMIQGPPGTGKTQVACSIITSAVNSGTRVLAIAETNIAVDNMTRRLASSGVAVLRLGDTGRVDSDLVEFTLEGQLAIIAEKAGKKISFRDMRTGKSMPKKGEVDKVMKSAMVVLTTCSGAGNPQLKGHNFPLLLVDEATQVREEVLLCGLGRGVKRLVMIGDPKQLGPIISLREITWLGEQERESLEQAMLDSPFSRLHQLGKFCFLDTQYRMHPAIAQFPSNTFYQGKLKTSLKKGDCVRRGQEVATIKALEKLEIVVVTKENQTIKWKLDEVSLEPPSFPWPDLTRPLAFIEVSGFEKRYGTSYCNREEVEAVQSVIRCLFSSPSLGLMKSDVTVLSLYSGQVNSLRQAQLGVEVATIDSFQGRENTVIVVSTVRAAGRLGYSDDPRRLNVLLTRARRALIIVGHRTTLTTSSLWSEWLAQAPALQLKDLVDTKGRSKEKKGEARGRPGSARGKQTHRPGEKTKTGRGGTAS
eukprot:GFUD01029359.1.p1 GENE.GFUD01029359.1~~GFUD01029359.1.p1  ORF type:complete len:1934 (+),score=582.76 GFUD01029359.1:141-5942(+)